MPSIENCIMYEIFQQCLVTITHVKILADTPDVDMKKAEENIRKTISKKVRTAGKTNLFFIFDFNNMQTKNTVFVFKTCTFFDFNRT